MNPTIINSTREEKKKNKYRCDKCEKSHRKCDRNIPTCTTCYKKNQECIYSRRREYNDFLHIINGKIIQDKSNTIQHDSQQTSNRKHELTYFFNKGMCKFRINKLPKSFNNEYTPLGIFNKSHNKSILENMMSLFQFPSPYKSNDTLSLFIDLAEKLGMFNKNITIRVLPKEIEKRNLADFDEIVNNSIQNYFKYSNTLLPIFIKSKFNFNTKSEILKMAIIITGISHMEKNEKVNYIFNYLSYKLEMLLGNIQRIKPTLQTIQALTILTAFSINLPFIMNNLGIYSTFCQKASDLLGLHLTPINLSLTQRIERDMTYSSLILSHLFLGIHFVFYFYLPYKPNTLKQEFDIILDRIMKQNNINQSINKHCLDYYFNLTMSSYNNDLSSILFSLRILKEKHLSSSYIGSDLKGLTEALIKRLEGLKSRYLILFYQLNNISLQNGYPVSQFNYQHHILFNHHFLLFYILSFMFYYPTKGNIHASHLDYLKDDNYISKVLTECHFCLNNVIQISIHYLTRLNICCSAQCLATLLRYKDKSEIDFNVIIQRGISCIRSLSKVDRISSYANINLNIINFIEKYK